MKIDVTSLVDAMMAKVGPAIDALKADHDAHRRQLQARNTELVEEGRSLRAEVERLRAVVTRLDGAIEWALGGEGSDFRPREPGDPPYWWRSELARRRGGGRT